VFYLLVSTVMLFQVICKSSQGQVFWFAPTLGSPLAILWCDPWYFCTAGVASIWACSVVSNFCEVVPNEHVRISKLGGVEPRL
jgi:hypothetical protein